MHLTDDEVQYTIGRTNKKGEATSCPFPPSHLPLHTNFQWERGVRVWGRGYPVLADMKVYNSCTSFPYFRYIKPVFFRHTNTSVGLGGCLQSRGFTASLDYSGLSVTDGRCPSYYYYYYFIFLTGNSRLPESSLKSSTNWSVFLMIPYSFLICIPYPRLSSLLENHSLHSSTYLYIAHIQSCSPYMAVAPGLFFFFFSFRVLILFCYR